MNQRKKIISIICATFNAENYLNDFLRSVESQDSNEFELIVVDGNSSDKTVDIIKSNENLISKYISENDKGVYDAWNKGIKLASGDWLAFVGADDKLASDFISVYLEVIKKVPLNTDYLSSKVNYVNKDGKILKILGARWKWEEFKYRMSTAHVGSLHNKKLFQQVGSYNINYRIVGDYELLLRKKEKLNTFFIDKVTINMLADGISLSYHSLIERRRAHILTAKISPIKANILFLIGVIFLFKLKWIAK